IPWIAENMAWHSRSTSPDGVIKNYIPKAVVIHVKNGSSNLIQYPEEGGHSVHVAATAGDTNIYGSIIQLYWEGILGRCMDMTEEVRQSALKIVEVVLCQGLVHPITCVPYLIAPKTDAQEEFSPNDPLKLGKALSRQNIPFDISGTYISLPTSHKEMIETYQTPSDSQFLKVASCASMSDLFIRLSRFSNGKKDATSNAEKLIQPLLKLLSEDGSEALWVEAVIYSKIMLVKCKPSISKKFVNCLALLPKTKGDEGSWSLMIQKALITINNHVTVTFQGLEKEVFWQSTLSTCNRMSSWGWLRNLDYELCNHSISKAFAFLGLAYMFQLVYVNFLNSKVSLYSYAANLPVSNVFHEHD
ncbi:hypothetical protein GIB67_032154, partial [Kingdonia uniflora]